jgi:hypothetical protein
MTPTSQGSGVASATHTHQPADKSLGPFMLTLCKLAAPIAVPQPQAPHLKAFTFFMGRSRQPGGSEQLQLHMGYFATLPDAQRWLKIMRGTYPHAVVSTVPAALLRLHAARVAALAPHASAAPAPAVAHVALTDASSLSDTQVFRILDTRRADRGEPAASDTQGSDISLIRPDDPDTRHVLRKAVLENAPVSFAVQLQWSVGPIDAAKIPSLEIFRAYTLYVGNGQHEGRSWHFLRLGFFNDAISAKQVAHYLRSDFATVAVVPVSEQERTRAPESRMRLPPPRVAKPVQEDATSTSGQVRKVTPVPSPKPLRPAVPVKTVASTARPQSTGKPGGVRAARTRTRAGEETLEQTLEMLAASVSLDSEPDEESGVRHLRVDVQKRA